MNTNVNREDYTLTNLISHYLLSNRSRWISLQVASVVNLKSIQFAMWNTAINLIIIVGFIYEQMFTLQQCLESIACKKLNTVQH